MTPQEYNVTETPFNLNVTFAAGETSKRISVLTEDDYRVEDDGTVTLSVPARPDQYKYIPGSASSASADVRDNDVPATASLYWTPPTHPYDNTARLDTALEGGSIYLAVYGGTRGEPLSMTLTVTEVGSYLDLDGEGAQGYENLGNGKLRVTLPVGLAIESVSIPLLENDVREADGSVAITIEPDPRGSYIPSVDRGTLTIPVKDNDTPPTVYLSEADDLTEGAQLSYTLTRTWDPGQSQGELSVNVKLAQTGDYITWPTDHQPDADGMVTIPVTIAKGSLTGTLTLETVDDEASEVDGSVTATILADAGGSYVTGTDSDHTTKLLDNDPPVISVAAVAAEVTEGTEAQFRFIRMGNTGVATRVGLYVGGLPKIMTDATEAIVLTSDNEDQLKRLHIYGAWVDYILEFAAGETEKTLSLTTEADNINEGDGWLGVRIVQRVANPFSIGTGYAQVLVRDDDVPTVSISQVTLPTGAATLESDTRVGEMGEAQPLSWVVSCSGNYEYSPLPSYPSVSGLPVQVEHIRLANHPGFYDDGARWGLGRNLLNFVSGGLCDGQARTSADTNRVVGPDGGVETFKLVPKEREPSIVAEYEERYRQAKAAADAAGTPITEHDIFHPDYFLLPHTLLINCQDEIRYCPKYRVGTPHKIRLTLVNRDPTILIKAESSTVEEGQAARFIVERRWHDDLLTAGGVFSETVVALRASQNGQYITGALPTELTFGRNETSKTIELATVDDSAFGENGSVTIELLPDTTGADLNIAGKYETFEDWSGHTPEGGRSDRATVTITNNDDKPGISIAPASASEGDSGSTTMTFTVTLAKAVTEAVTVNCTTSDGTATAGQDYTAVSNGSVTIAAGNTTAEFTVSLTGDETDELDETFNVTISLPLGATEAAITGAILDDDPAVVTVAPKKSPVTEGEEVVFVLTRTGVTDEELYMLVDVEDPARSRLMIAEFDADAVTAELSIATENNDLVDYPSERDYTLHVYGDGYFGGRDDERYTPGDPDEATVTVQDNDTLVVVAVEPVSEVVSTGESVQFRFRRTGSIAEALTISFQGFEHPSSGDATLADASVTFLAGNDTVVYTNDVTSNGTVNPISRAHTVLIYGDAGRGGLHRSWIAGDPNRATVVVGDNNSSSYMAMTASYPSRVAAAESASVEYTVTNLGTRALLGYENRVSDGTRISTTPDRGRCDIRDEIPAGESRTCSASFTVTNQDVTNGKIEFNATARNLHKSSTLRVYIRVAQPVEFGFTATTTLEVTEGPNVTATLPVTRTGRLDEAVTVAYRLRPHGTRPAALGEDFTDPSSTPGLLTFPANVTSANIVINITQDQIDEERERFRVDLVPFTDGTITERKNSRVVRIIDEHQENDPYRPTASLQLVSADPTPESADSVDFAVVLDRVWGREGRYEVELDAHDNLTATPAFSRLGQTGDFEAPDGLIHATIPAGQTRFEFSLTLYDDDVREEDETFQLLLTSPYVDSFRTIGTSNTALATIADDDRIPPAEVVMSLSHNGSALESVPEGSSQRDITVTASFPQIRWPGDASNAPLRPADPRGVDTTVWVRFDPNSGATHAAGLDDFAPLRVEDDQGAFQEVESFDIAIPAGQTSGTTTLRFKPANDDVDEEDETVTLMGSELVAGDSADSLPVRSASFTIIDDDTRGITPSSSSALSGLSLVEGGEPETYSLVLDSQPTDTVVITLAGNQGGFLRIVPDTLTFATSDWATPQTVSVMALDDGIAGGVGPQDLITHQVSGGDYGSVSVPDILVSIEDTTQASVYLEGGQASESDGHVEFTVTVRPVLRTTPVLVRYATVDGTAIAASDYTREVETGQTYKILNIPGGQSSATIRIPITDDQVYESADETFTLQLTNHNNRATLDGGAIPLTATGTIADDDPKPVVSVAGPAGEVSYVSENVKDPVTFTLTLMGQSAGDVTVDYATGEAGLLGLLTARQGLAGATEDEDYAGTLGTVTFTSGQTTKTVTVQVTDDEVSEETEFFGFKISKPQGADLRGQRSEDVADVGLVDDDARGVTIAPTSIGLDEPASGETAVVGSYTVNLNSKPTDTATVTIGGSDPAVSLSGDTLTNSQLTFTTTNWNTAQTITVTPVKDDNAVGETVTLTHTLSGGDYARIAADSVTINLTDSDTRNVVLSRPSLTLTEGDAAGMTYTVRLATEPSGSVSVSITGHSGTDLTLSTTTLTFTVDDWDDAQTVTVTAEEDDDGVTDAVATLTHTASGGDYANVTRDLPVTVRENDTAGVTIEPTALSVVAGRSNEYTVALATQPTGEVTVTISGHVSTDVSLSGDTLDNTTLTFTVGDWDTAQTVTVSATQSASTAKVPLAHAVAGADYGSVTAESVVVSVVGVAGQQPTIQVGVSSSAQALTVPEGGSNSYTLVLSSRPTGDVSIGVTLPTGTDLRLDKTSLTFTSTNWDDAQTVTVTAEEDDDGVTDAVATLMHTISGGGYGSTTVPDVEVSIMENDSADIVLSETDLAVTEGDAVGTSYTVALATQPSSSVSVSITGHSGTDLTLSSTTLSFTTSTWDTAQPVRVTAVDDANAVDESETLTHTASGGEYAGVSAGVGVKVVDDDTPELALSTSTVSVVEGDAVGASYTVRLSHEPTGAVTVEISGHEGTALRLSATMLSFATSTWDVPQAVGVTAVDDANAVDESETLTHTASGGEYGGVSAGVGVRVVDDAPETVAVSFGSDTYTVAEGGTQTVTVVLSEDPDREVVIPITKEDRGGATSTDYSGVPADVTFASGQTSKSFTFEAIQDDADDDGESVLLGFGTLPEFVESGATTTATVSITDDDDPRVSVSFESDTYTVAEGSTTTVTVVLSADPERRVTIDLVKTNLDGATDSDYSGVPDSVTFSRRETEFSFVFTAARDLIGDGGESVEMAFATELPPGVDPGATSTSSVRIIDVSPQAGTPPLLVSFGHSVYPVPEGATVTVTLSAAPGSDVTVPITKAEKGGATTTDYTGVPEVVTFGATETEKRFVFTATQDSDDDDGESVELGFGDLSGGVQPGTIATTSVEISDDDAPETVEVSFGSDTYTVAEGSTETVTVVLSEDPDREVVIPITKEDRGGATSTDYSGVPADVTFVSGQTSKTFTFEAIQDDADDDGESVLLGFGTLPPSVTPGRNSQATVSIEDDDGAGVSVSEPSLTIVEGSSDTYTVVLDSQPTAGVTVTINDPSVNTDVTADPASLTFSSSDWSSPKTVTVNAAHDNDADDDTATVTHTVTSSDSSYSGVSANSVVVSVTDDDDVRVTVSFDQASYRVLEGDAVMVGVTLSADPQSTVIIPLEATGQDGATSDDYHVPSSVTINGGETSKTFEFMAMADDASDNGESVMIGFGTNLPSRVTKGTPKETLVSIRQMTLQLGSGVTVQFEADAYTVSEGGTATITVTLSADPQSTVVIPITATNQGGVTSSDYSIVSSSVTFNSGDTSQTITFSATEDMEDELGESVLLAFGPSLPSEVSAGTPSQTTVSIKDGCADGDIWCASMDFNRPDGRHLRLNQIDNKDFHHDGVDYQLISISVIQNGHHGGGDVNISWPFGIPERTKWSMDFRNLNSGLGSEQFDMPNEDWRDWTLHVSTVSDGDTLTAALRFSEARDTGQSWWWWYGRDIDHLRRVWTPGQVYRLRLVEDPRSERTPQPLNSPLYLHDRGVVNTNQVYLRWLAPQTRDDQVPPVDSYKIQWKQSSSSWDMGAAVSEVTDRPTGNHIEGYFLGELTPGDEYNIRVIATDSVGDSEPSNEITYMMPGAGQQAVSNTPAEGEPRIDGTPEAGQTLSADTSAITDIDGLEEVVFQHQWLADGSEISGATGPTNTLTSDDEGRAITVRVDFTDDAGNDESLTSASVVVTARLELQSATVDGATLTLTYNEVLDNIVRPSESAFAVNVNGESSAPMGVAMGQSNVLLLLSQAVAAGDTVTVDYTAPDGANGIQDTLGRKADSFTGQLVTNNTAPADAGRSDPAEPPGSPNSLDVVRHESGKLRASWSVPDSGTAPTGYTVQWKESGDDWADQDDVSEANVKGTSHVIAGLTDGVEYAVRVIAYKDDAESAPSGEVTATPQETEPPAPSSASVDGATLTITFDEPLDPGETPDRSAFAATVSGAGRGVETVAVSGSGVTITLVSAVCAGETVTVGYMAPVDASAARLQDLTGNAAASFSERQVTNNTRVTDQLTACARGVPASHDGSASFTFELRFSEEFPISYKTLRDHAFTVTGGEVVNARRLERPGNIR